MKEMLKDTRKLKENAERRRVRINIDLIEELNGKRIELTRELNNLNAERRNISSNSSINCSSSTGGISRDLRKNLIKNLAQVEEELLTEISTIPNWTCDQSPLQDNNKIIKESAVDYNRNGVDHMDICKKFDLVDFEGPARTSGAHFYALKGIGALLEIALTSWAMNRAIQRGFVPVSAPDCLRERFVVGCGFRPRRQGSDLDSNADLPVYTINEPEKESDPLILAGTSEMYLASQHSGQILPKLPLKYVGVSHCFRSEVGHHTAASRGLYRVHQFTKIELFTFCDPQNSAEHFHEITDLQASLLDELGLPYRVLEMANWELGASAFRKWDHEVWMPGRRIWGEVMSTSNCTDYQSRRLAIRYRQSNNGDLIFPYTLNGTACAVPRIIMALLEHGWDPAEPEYLNLPTVLEPFLSHFNLSSQLKLCFK